MSSILPGTEEFRTNVYGTVFAGRAAVVRRLRVGDRLILVPDPADVENPVVWVHAQGGDVVGHLSPDVSSWMVPWMLGGAVCGASVASVAGDDVASWKRLVVAVRCARTSPGAASPEEPRRTVEREPGARSASASRRPS